MTIQLEWQSPVFSLVGDGVSTTVDLSPPYYPLHDMPGYSPASMFVVEDGYGLLSTVSTGSGGTMRLTFNSAFSGRASGFKIGVIFNL